MTDDRPDTAAQLDRAERRIYFTREYLAGIPEHDPAHDVAQQALRILVDGEIR